MNSIFKESKSWIGTLWGCGFVAVSIDALSKMGWNIVENHPGLQLLSFLFIWCDKTEDLSFTQ